MPRSIRSGIAAALFGAVAGIAQVAQADDCDVTRAEASADGEEREIPLECVRITAKIARKAQCEVKQAGKIKIKKVATAHECFSLRGKLVRPNRATRGILQRPRN